MKRIAINGTFLLEKRTGIHRYAEEMVKALDKMAMGMDIVLVTSKKATCTLTLSNIRLVQYGKFNGIFWEQICFAFYVITRCAVPINLCNVTPLLKPTGISAIHDISYKVNPQFFPHLYGFLSRNWHCFNYWIICKFASQILTVSEFSKNEIIKYYNENSNRITVTPNGWQHFSIEGFNDAVMDKYPQLEKGQYFFSMASVAKNKNFRWVLEVAGRNPQFQFTISGSFNPKRLGENLDFQKLKNVHFLGYVEDNEVKVLIKNCKAFLFPSLYEGFGLPPLEAMALGVQVVVATTASLPEVCGNSVHYIDPNDYSVDFEKLLAQPVAPQSEVLGRYSWEGSARKMMELIK